MFPNSQASSSSAPPENPRVEQYRRILHAAIQSFYSWQGEAAPSEVVSRADQDWVQSFSQYSQEYALQIFDKYIPIVIRSISVPSSSANPINRGDTEDELQVKMDMWKRDFLELDVLSRAGRRIFEARSRIKPTSADQAPISGLSAREWPEWDKAKEKIGTEAYTACVTHNGKSPNDYGWQDVGRGKLRPA